MRPFSMIFFISHPVLSPPQITNLQKRWIKIMIIWLQIGLMDIHLDMRKALRCNYKQMLWLRQLLRRSDQSHQMLDEEKSYSTLLAFHNSNNYFNIWINATCSFIINIFPVEQIKRRYRSSSSKACQVKNYLL